MADAKSTLAEARRLNPAQRERGDAYSPNLPIMFEGYHRAGLPEE
jgi:hypothetical protein